MENVESKVEENATSNAETTNVNAETRDEKIEKTIQNHVYTAMGIGLIPVPMVDFLGVTTTQVSLIYNLCKIYDVNFTENTAKNIITALVGGGLTAPIGTFLGSMIKIIPVVGQTVGVLAMPVVAGSTTYAVGKVIALHLDSGGSLLNFDAKKMKEHYSNFCKEGEEKAKSASC